MAGCGLPSGAHQEPESRRRVQSAAEPPGGAASEQSAQPPAAAAAAGMPGLPLAGGAWAASWLASKALGSRAAAEAGRRASRPARNQRAPRAAAVCCEEVMSVQVDHERLPERGSKGNQGAVGRWEAGVQVQKEVHGRQLRTGGDSGHSNCCKWSSTAHAAKLWGSLQFTTPGRCFTAGSRHTGTAGRHSKHALWATRYRPHHLPVLSLPASVAARCLPAIVCRSGAGGEWTA